MKSRTWLKDLVEEWSFEHYLKNNPLMVEGIKRLLIAGEKPARIRKFCKQNCGNAALTASTIGHMIDFVNKQVKN